MADVNVHSMRERPRERFSERSTRQTYRVSPISDNIAILSRNVSHPRRSLERSREISPFSFYFIPSHNYRRLRSRESSRRKIASRRHHNENSNLARQPDNGPIVVMNLSLWSPNFSSTVYNAPRHARGRAFAATRLHVNPSMCIYVNERWRRGKSDTGRERERERERDTALLCRPRALAGYTSSINTTRVRGKAAGGV